jgi:ketosteroid isomerase-like protein
VSHDKKGWNVDNETLMLELFAAIESRDFERVLQIYDPGVEFYWPPGLPYGASGRSGKADEVTWQSIWLPLQPEPSDRRMDPRVIGSRGDEVAILYHQRGRDSKGNVIDDEVIGLYEVVHGKLRRAQMFHFDEPSVVAFLQRAT